MKIQVVRGDGKHEVLEFTQPLKVVSGQGQNSITSSNGMTHFFTQEGIYDGWDMNMPDSITTLAEVEDIIRFVESNREIIGFPQEQSQIVH